MIVDIQTEAYKIISDKFSLRPWQEGVVAEIMSLDTSHGIIDRNHFFKSINMGRRAGHTYLAKSLASKEFPLPTKLYVSSHDVKEYHQFFLSPNLCHFDIEIIEQPSEFFDPARVHVVDMSKHKFSELYKNQPILENIYRYAPGLVIFFGGIF